MGLKLRVPQSDIFIRALRRSARARRRSPTTRCFPSLSTHLIDGAENNWPSFYSSRHFEIAPHWSQSEHAFAPDMLLMSKRAADALPPSNATSWSCGARIVTAHAGRWDRLVAASRHRGRCGRRGERDRQAAFRSAVQPLLDRYLARSRDPAPLRLCCVNARSSHGSDHSAERPADPHRPALSPRRRGGARECLRRAARSRSSRCGRSWHATCSIRRRLDGARCTAVAEVSPDARGGRRRPPGDALSLLARLQAAGRVPAGTRSRPRRALPRPRFGIVFAGWGARLMLATWELQITGRTAARGAHTSRRSLRAAR